MKTPTGASREAKERDARIAEARKARAERRFDDAIRIGKDLMAENPDDPEALQQLSLSLASIPDRIPEAIGYLEPGVGKHANSAALRSLLGGLYRLENRFEEALEQTSLAMKLAPDDMHCVLNHGLVHRDLGDDEAALGCFLATVAKDPRYSDAHLGIAEILLARGEWGPGWIEYEARLPPGREVRGGEDRWPEMVAPKWNGMRLPRGRIMIIADQGYGDVLQFARYIPMVAERCNEAVLVCDGALAPLLRALPGLALFSNDWKRLPAHTAWCRTSSLPSIFETRVESIPQPGPYIHPPADRVAHWRDRLNDAMGDGRLRVGLVWAGRPTHGNDRRRSIRFDFLRPLLEVSGVRFVLLQKPIPERDQARIGEFPSLWSGPDALTDFGETAALIANLDLVISVDSAVSHLTGAMGKPVWILLPWLADWRWLKATDRSPWYPTARLFRQASAGDWSVPIARIAADLQAHSGSHLARGAMSLA